MKSSGVGAVAAGTAWPEVSAAAEYPDPDGRPARRDAVSRRAGRLPARPAPARAGRAVARASPTPTPPARSARPARAAFMTGQLPSRTRVYDNAAEFASDIPTFAHHLRRGRLSRPPLRQDALRRTRPVARLRGAADDRHLPGRFRLDAGLRPSPASASTGGITIWARSPAPASPRSPTRSSMTTRSPSTRPRSSTTCRAAHDAAALVPDGQLHPPARPLCRAAAILGPLCRLPGARPRGPARSPSTTQDPHSRRLLRRQRPQRLRDHPRGRPRARGAATSPTSPTSTSRSASSSACSSAAAWPTTPSSSSSPTMATCSASAACGSR